MAFAHRFGGKTSESHGKDSLLGDPILISSVGHVVKFADGHVGQQLCRGMILWMVKFRFAQAGMDETMKPHTG